MRATSFLLKWFCLTIGAVFFATASATFVQSNDPPKEPILRIETGMHMGNIRRIATDGEQRYLITGSLDKTVRVWELSTGTLIRTLRPPIGNNREGIIFAVAISPDGKTVACGGVTGTNFDGKTSIYLFDRETGAILRRVSRLPEVIASLAYSSDGRFLVATLAGKKGIQVYETAEYDLLFQDSDYAGESNSADFNGDSKLVTTSFDGYLRLYSLENKTFTLVKKEKLKGGQEPHFVKFSPDGSRIAVGYYDSSKIEVLSSLDLSYLYSPDTSGFSGASFIRLAWSWEGTHLYGAGRLWNGGRSVILKWSEGGKGPWEAIVTDARNTITGLLPLKTGGVVFAAADPVLGTIGASGTPSLFKRSAIPDYRNNPQGLLISHDGATVEFAYELWGKTPARFSILDRLLGSPEPDRTPKAVKPPITRGLRVTDWSHSYYPKLNGVRIDLDDHETSHCLAISPDAKSFLLGTSWNLCLFDGEGEQVWSVPSHGETWAVNISGDGRVAVAAFGDGTIRWYRMKDGKEILALFPHGDRKRWVLWTPSGYYDASAGADELIGWHINNGKAKAADFFPISRFRSDYNRSDVVAKVLETLDEGGAVKLANEEAGRRTRKRVIKESLPPVVTILTPKDGAEIRTPEIMVKYTVRSPSGDPVSLVQARVNGNPASDESGLNLIEKETTRTMRVTIPEKDSRVAIIAKNSFGESEPAIIRIKWAGEAQKGVDTRPNLYILAIGVSKYKDESLRDGVTYAAKDAKDFADIINKQEGAGIYKSVKTILLLDDDARTRTAILSGFGQIEKQTTNNDVAMIFLAGHGETDQKNRYYFLPLESSIADFTDTGVPQTDIVSRIRDMQGSVIMFVDTCYSGGIVQATRGRADIDRIVNEIASATKDGVIFASSTGNQRSQQVDGNGAFTKALIEGFKGKAVKPGTKEITIGTLSIHVAERVKELTNGTQTPRLIHFKEDGLGINHPLAVKTSD